MFFLHRGVEKVAEGKSLDDGIVLAEQIAGDESVANAVAYCQAVELLAGIRVPARARLLRVVLLELERIYSHLADLGGMAMDVGFYQSSSRFALLREEAMRMNARLTGSRFLKGACAIGGLSRDFDAQALSAVFSHLQTFNKNFVLLNKMALASSTFLDRTFMTGVLEPEESARLAAVGPVARASGLPCDLRKWLPYAAYGDIGFYEVTGENGDVLSRYYVKSDEVRESIGMVMAAIIELGNTHGSVCAPKPAPAAFASKLGFGWAEAPRGACTMMVGTDANGKIARFACRTASFRNWRAIEQTIGTIIMPDFPLVNKSFNLAYAGNDL
jgi:Ni,Fe-hydrogenase III large subunit